MSELIEEEPRGRFARLRKRIREKKELRRAEKTEIKRIAEQERVKLQRTFIRKQVKRKMAKKFTPQQFRLEEARRKSQMQKFSRVMGQTGKPVGEQLLENLGGFGVKPAITKPKKKKRQQFVLMRI